MSRLVILNGTKDDCLRVSQPLWEDLDNVFLLVLVIVESVTTPVQFGMLSTLQLVGSLVDALEVVT